MADILDFKKIAVIIGFFTLFSGVGVVGTAQADAGFNEHFANCLQQNECHQCNTDPDFKNPWGYMGFYQMGVNYASEAVCSNPGSMPLMKTHQDWNLFTQRCTPSAAAIANGWVTQNADGSYNHVWMQGGNPQNVDVARQMQTAILMANSEAHWNWIQANLGDYIGEIVNGVEMTKETMVAMAHLLGRGGLRKTLQGNSVVDGNGTSGGHYAACLQGCMNNGGTKGECTYTVDNICRDS